MKRRTQGRCLFGAILLLASLVAGFSLAQAGFKRSYGGREWDEIDWANPGKQTNPNW